MRLALESGRTLDVADPRGHIRSSLRQLPVQRERRGRVKAASAASAASEALTRLCAPG